VQKDPSGRCLEDGCVFEVAATLGFVGGIANQAFDDYQTGAFNQRSLAQNIGTYLIAGGEGAVVAGGTAVAGLGAAAYGLSSAATVFTTGATAGTLTAGTTVSGNALSGQSTDPYNLAFNSAIAALTAGSLKAAPAVRGRLPGSFSTALLGGAHAERAGAEAFAGASIQFFGASSYRFASSFGNGSKYGTAPVANGGSGSGTGGGGGSSSLVGLYQSLVSTLSAIVGILSGSHK
jgi:hypothetical protein